jgi:hypothetical protein
MMDEAEVKFSQSPLDDGLSFDDRLPLAFVVCHHLPTISERVRLNDRNVSLLKTHALEDFQRREVDADLEGIASEIERLDQKLTLVTELCVIYRPPSKKFRRQCRCGYQSRGLNALCPMR